MAIFNISISSGYELPSASWVNNDPNTRPKPLQFNGGPECKNAHYSLNSGCESLFGDRFAISSKLRSGSFDTVLSNGNQVNKGNPELSIRIVEDNSAIQVNYYNEVYGTFVSGFPQSFLYYLPKQTVSTTYTTSKNFYANSSPTRNVAQTEREQFLSKDYKNKFLSKNTILLAVPQDFNNELTYELKKNVLSINNSLANGLVCNFIQPSGFNSSDNYIEYFKYGNVGISLNTNNNPITNIIYTMNIQHSGEIIINIIYDSKYINQEIILKHTSINNYLLINLPSNNFITLDLEDYQ